MESIQQIPLDKIERGDNDRTVFDAQAITELAENIQAHGLVQPISVRPYGAPGRYQVVAGERRYKAVQSLGWSTIAAIVRNLDDQEAAGVMLAENLARADLNPIDEARAYNKRMQLFGWNVQECATRCKVPGLRIRERLALLNLTEEIQRRVAFGHLRLEYAQPMCDLDHNRQSIALQYLTVREGRRMSVTEFKAVCSRLYGEQSQEVMFNFEDFADIANRRDQALEDQKSKRYIPTQSTLPDLAPAATIGLALEKYIYTLLQSDNAEHIMAASVAGTIYTGLIKHGLCKQPDQSPLDNLKM